MAEANASAAGRNDLGEGRSQHRLVVHIYRNEATRVEKVIGTSPCSFALSLWQGFGCLHELFLGD